MYAATGDTWLGQLSGASIALERRLAQYFGS